MSSAKQDTAKKTIAKPLSSLMCKKCEYGKLVANAGVVEAECSHPANIKYFEKMLGCTVSLDILEISECGKFTKKVSTWRKHL